MLKLLLTWIMLVLNAILASGEVNKIYKDIFTGDEIFSDAHTINLVDNVIYEVYGKIVSETAGDDPKRPHEINASDVDIVLDHDLQETSFAVPRDYIKYLSPYLKNIVNRLQEKDPDQVEPFKTNVAKFMKEQLERFDDLRFFLGKSMDFNGMIAIIEYKEVDGEDIPVLYAFKDGLEEVNV